MIKVIDNFYSNAEAMRDFALKQDFEVRGNFPGLRTEPYTGESHLQLKEIMEGVVGKEILFWPSTYNTSFQYTTKKDRTWVHHDGEGLNMAALVYLTPDAPVAAGTSFYKHKITGIHTHSESAKVDFNSVETKPEDWEETDRVGNFFNRLVVYDATKYHASSIAGFGSCKKTGRLFQTFFFSV